MRLRDVADVLENDVELSGPASGTLWRLIEGSDIRANEGSVVPQFPMKGWQVAAKKGQKAYRVRARDILVGLVRPERRNIGLLLHEYENMLATPDGTAAVRLKKSASAQYTTEWLFLQLRSEQVRLQLWTESGGTSYGKLNYDHIRDVVLPKPSEAEIKDATAKVKAWAEGFANAFAAWEEVGTEEDRRPIINSAIIGLDGDD